MSAPMPDGIDLTRLLEIENAATRLAVKIAQHDRRGWTHIRLGSFAPLLAALSATPVAAVDLDPAGLHDVDSCALWLSDSPDVTCTCAPVWPLLVGERGSVADRLDAVALPCEEAS